MKIAFIENPRAVLVVVHAPHLNEIYAASKTEGAFRCDGGARKKLQVRKLPVRAKFLLSRSHRDDALDRALQHAPPFDSIGIGSSLKFCRIAEGAADLYLRTGPTSEWDTAAGQCVLESAGGAVWQMPQMTPLACNEKDSLLNPGFAAVGDTKADWGWLTKT